jgi:flavorubredoxin
MNKRELVKGVYYVGGQDWRQRDFHGYVTARGVTYNSYLIVDEKICLVDLVKNTFAEELLERIGAVLPPEQIDYIVMNHLENDHASALPRVMEKAVNAQALATAAGVREATRLYGSYNYKTVKDGDVLTLGETTLRFVTLPMLHWPDSMASYLPERGILFSNDAFGQHICSSKLFDDENDLSKVMEEAEKYYANILQPYSKLIGAALAKTAPMAPALIAPSHGIVWRSHIKDILDKYAFWGKGGVRDKILVLYDTMWGGTECMAKALFEGVCRSGAEARLYKLGSTENSHLAAELLESSGALFGSPTLNSGMMPSMGGLLTYLKGLKPAGKLAAVFGTYGWNGGAQKDMEELLQKAGMKLAPGFTANWTASAEELQSCEEFGFSFAQKTKEQS